MVTIQKGHEADRKQMIILANSLYRQSDRHEGTAATIYLEIQPSNPQVLPSLCMQSPTSRSLRIYPE